MSAVRARFERDAPSISRLYFDYATGRRIGIMTKALAAARRIYRCVEPAELEKIGGTIHHGGIVAVVAAPKPSPVTADDPAAWGRKGDALLILDRIGNAHNLGALARTAAFFGIPRLILPEDPAAARPNDAAYRIAEGGLEWLTVHRVRDLPAFLKALSAAGYEVIGASSRPGSATPAAAVARVADPGAEGPALRPRALILGNEEHGLSAEAAAACTRLETISGSGKIESLNVSVAGAILMREFLAPARGSRLPAAPASGARSSRRPGPARPR